MEETGKDIEFMYEKSSKLIVEEPKWVELSVMNCTNKTMKLELDIEPETNHNITIHGLSRYSLKKLVPGDKSKFKALLFPQYLGIHKLNGLIAKDKYSGIQYTLTENDSDITFEVLKDNNKSQSPRKNEPFENVESPEKAEGDNSDFW